MVIYIRKLWKTNVLGSKLKDLGRGSQNHWGNIGIRLQKTKLVQTKVSVEAQVSHDAPNRSFRRRKPWQIGNFWSDFFFFFFTGAVSLREEWGNTPRQIWDLTYCDFLPADCLLLQLSAALRSARSKQQRPTFSSNLFVSSKRAASLTSLTVTKKPPPPQQ